jgi:membrane fusion protein
VEREAAANERELANLAERYAKLRAENERAILALRQEATELESRRRIVVTAPAAGRLSLLQADVGQTVDPQRAVAHIVPAGAPLVARLYAPSRTAGFTRKGMPVLLRYDAFPYQKFGQHQGQVTSVAATAVSAAEINNGLSTAVAPGSNADDLLFAITVSLPAQTIGTGADARALQSGMRLEADLMQETRRLYEWMLEPLFSTTRRMESP